MKHIWKWNLYESFVRSGSLLYDDPSPLLGAGQDGEYWSSAASSYDDYAYLLGFYDSIMTPSGDISRYYGRSLRCLAS